MKNLQNYLIQINARIKRDIVDKKYLAEYESLKINELSDFKYKNNTAIIEYIKRGCNILCGCGKTTLTWDSYKMQYNKMCKECQYKEQKEKTYLISL